MYRGWHCRFAGQAPTAGAELCTGLDACPSLRSMIAPLLSNNLRRASDGHGFVVLLLMSVIDLASNPNCKRSGYSADLENSAANDNEI